MGHDPVPVGIPEFESIEKMYEACIEQVEALLTPSSSSTTTTSSFDATNITNPFSQYARLITGLANVSAVLFYNMNAQYTGTKDAPLHSLPINWCGFYILDRPDRLALSTFQGKVACQHIKLGKGMCGRSVLTNTDLAIEDVHADPAHIACDAASQSEAVIALRDPSTNRAVGCLDIDSSVKGRFTKEQDLAPLRKICDIIQTHLGAEISAMFAGISAKATANVQASSNPMLAASSSGLLQTSIAAVKIMPGGVVTPLTTGALRTGPLSASTTSASTVQHHPPIVHNQKHQNNNSNNSATNTPALDESKIVKHGCWELRHRTVHEMLNSQKMELLETSLGVKLLPEIIFGLNEIHFVMEQSAVKPLKFRVCAQTALQNVVQYSTSETFQKFEKDALFPVESASWEAQRKTMKTFDPKVDWAFRNNYRGVWSDANGEPVELIEKSAAQCEPDDLIDYGMLRDTNLPILFFAAPDLWEDDLHDSGMSKMMAKARVMEPCFFTLVRHVLRVDNVTMQVRDTRHFHKFGTNKICIEESLKSVDIKHFLTVGAGKVQGYSSEEFHRNLMNTPVEGLSMLEEKWKKNYVIKL